MAPFFIVVMSGCKKLLEQHTYGLALMTSALVVSQFEYCDMNCVNSC